MGGYKVTFKNPATKELQTASSKQVLNKLSEKIKCLASDQHPQGLEKLAGRSAVYRLRQGDDRAIYTVDHQEKVGHRRGVYR